MIEKLNPYGPIIEPALMLLAIAVVLGGLLGVLASEVFIPQPEMRVLSAYDAVERGWPAEWSK